MYTSKQTTGSTTTSPTATTTGVPPRVLRIPEDFSDVQAALDAARPNDAICLLPNVYDCPTPLRVDKPIHFIGMDDVGSMATLRMVVTNARNPPRSLFTIGVGSVRVKGLRFVVEGTAETSAVTVAPGAQNVILDECVFATSTQAADRAAKTAAVVPPVSSVTKNTSKTTPSNSASATPAVLSISATALATPTVAGLAVTQAHDTTLSILACQFVSTSVRCYGRLLLERSRFVDVDGAALLVQASEITTIGSKGAVTVTDRAAMASVKVNKVRFQRCSVGLLVDQRLHGHANVQQSTFQDGDVGAAVIGGSGALRAASGTPVVFHGCDFSNLSAVGCFVVGAESKLEFTKNALSLCHIGLLSGCDAKNVIVRANAFQSCEKALWIAGGGGPSIEGNLIEGSQCWGLGISGARPTVRLNEFVKNRRPLDRRAKLNEESKMYIEEPSGAASGVAESPTRRLLAAEGGSPTKRGAPNLAASSSPSSPAPPIRTRDAPLCAAIVVDGNMAPSSFAIADLFAFLTALTTTSTATSSYLVLPDMDPVMATVQYRPADPLVEGNVMGENECNVCVRRGGSGSFLRNEMLASVEVNVFVDGAMPVGSSTATTTTTAAPGSAGLHPNTTMSLNVGAATSPLRNSTSRFHANASSSSAMAATTTTTTMGGAALLAAAASPHHVGASRSCDTQQHVVDTALESGILMPVHFNHNEISGAVGSDVIYCGSQSLASFVGNTITDATAHGAAGVLLEHTAMVELRNNTLERCPRGVVVKGRSSGKIVGNTFSAVVASDDHNDDNKNHNYPSAGGSRRASSAAPSAARDPPIDIQSDSQLSVFVAQNVFSDGSPI